VIPRADHDDPALVAGEVMIAAVVAFIADSVDTT
jgi:hypothetical protein